MRGRAILVTMAMAMSVAACGEAEPDAAASADGTTTQECIDFARFVTSGAVSAAQLVEDCGISAAEAEAAVSANPAPTTAPTTAPPAEGTYGSDPALDRLQDRCAAGEADACRTLFLDSPFGSEYEAFAEARGGAEQSATEALEMAIALARAEFPALHGVPDADMANFAIEACKAFDNGMSGEDIYTLIMAFADDMAQIAAFSFFLGAGVSAVCPHHEDRLDV